MTIINLDIFDLLSEMSSTIKQQVKQQDFGQSQSGLYWASPWHAHSFLLCSVMHESAPFLFPLTAPICTSLQNNKRLKTDSSH
jgi:hypothetical protein